MVSIGQVTADSEEDQILSQVEQVMWQWQTEEKVRRLEMAFKERIGIDEATKALDKRTSEDEGRFDRSFSMDWHVDSICVIMRSDYEERFNSVLEVKFPNRDIR